MTTTSDPPTSKQSCEVLYEVVGINDEQARQVAELLGGGAVLWRLGHTWISDRCVVRPQGCKCRHCSPIETPQPATKQDFEPCYCVRCDGKLPAPCRYGQGKQSRAERILSDAIDMCEGWSAHVGGMGHDTIAALRKWRSDLSAPAPQPGASKHMDFGDYCRIEQKRYGVPNEMYQYKVIGRLFSSAWVDVPVDVRVANGREVNQSEMEEVIAAICCGVSEREVLRFRAVDCRPDETTPEQPSRTVYESMRAAIAREIDATKDPATRHRLIALHANSTLRTVEPSGKLLHDEECDNCGAPWSKHLTNKLICPDAAIQDVYRFRQKMASEKAGGELKPHKYSTRGKCDTCGGQPGDAIHAQNGGDKHG